MSFFAELKRRNVFRVGIAYALVAWVVLQILDVLVGVVDAPAWVLQVFFMAAAVGLLAVVIFAWVFEMTPEGIKRESEIDRSKSITPHTGRKLDRIIIVFLAVAVAFLLADRYRQADTPSTDPAAGPESPLADREGTPPKAVSEEESLAVLPFVAMSSGEDDEYFADGLTEEILNALAQLPELLVTARTSSFSFKGQDVPVPQIADTLGVRHIVEGSVRRSGDRIRVTAQLIRAEDGFHLWSDNYDSDSDDAIAVQEDIAEQIALALDVVLDDSKRKAMQLAGLRNVEAFTLYQQARRHYQIAHGESPDQISALRQANELIERVLELSPGFAPARVEHSDLFAHLMLDEFASAGPEFADAALIEESQEKATQDYDLAIRHARNESEKVSFELDRAFISGQWRGLPARARRVLGDSGCTTNNWISTFGNVYGFASELVPYTKTIRVCDPLVSIEWFNEARALFWAGELEASLAVAMEGSELAPGGWLNHQLVYTMSALGRFEDAERVALTRMQSDFDAALARMIIAAARGERDLLDQRYREYVEASERDFLFTLAYHAWAGHREEANRMAAAVDELPARHIGMTLYVLWCACGAPWDIEHTPQLAADLAEAGLPWPPPSPIKFPLKTW